MQPSSQLPHQLRSDSLATDEARDNPELSIKGIFRNAKPTMNFQAIIGDNMTI